MLIKLIIVIILSQIKIILTEDSIREKSSIYLTSSRERETEIERIEFLNTDIIFQKRKYINYSTIDNLYDLSANRIYIIPEKRITDAFYNTHLLGGFLNKMESDYIYWGTITSGIKEIRKRLSEAWLYLLNFHEISGFKNLMLRQCKKRLPDVKPLNCDMNIQKEGWQFYSWSLKDEHCARPIYIEIDDEDSLSSIQLVRAILKIMGSEKYKEINNIINYLKKAILKYQGYEFVMDPYLFRTLWVPKWAKVFYHHKDSAPFFNQFASINDDLKEATGENFGIGDNPENDEYIMAYLNHMKFMVATDICLSMKEILKSPDISNINFFVGRVYRDNQEINEVVNLNNVDYYAINKTIKLDRKTTNWKNPCQMNQESYEHKSPLIVYKTQNNLHNVITTETEGKKWTIKPATKDITDRFCNNRTCIYLGRNNNQIYKVDTNGSYIWFEERLINMSDVSPKIPKSDIESKLREYYCSIRNCTVKARDNNQYGLLYRILNTETLWNTATDYLNKVDEYEEYEEESNTTTCDPMPKESYFSMDLYMALLNLIHPVITPTAQTIDTIAGLLSEVENPSVTVDKIYETLEILSNSPSSGFEAILNILKNQVCVNKMIDDFVKKTRHTLNEYDLATRVTICSLEWKSVKVDEYPQSTCLKTLKEIDNRLTCNTANINVRISTIIFPGNTVPTVVYCHREYSGKVCYIPDAPGNIKCKK